MSEVSLSFKTIACLPTVVNFGVIPGKYQYLY